MRDPQYMLMCRSLTYAQRSARALERAGITGTVSRVPKSVSPRGCGYCVVVSTRNRDRALAALRAAKLAPERILAKGPDGTIREVEHDLP